MHDNVPTATGRIIVVRFELIKFRVRLVALAGCPTCDCDCPSMMCPAAVKNCTNLKQDADGCSTCTCDDQQDKPVIDVCPELACALTCDHGMQRDESGCPQCSCNRCPLQLCRMFCPYGFRRNDQGCQVCECDWSPVVEKIECSEVGLSTLAGLLLIRFRFVE